MANGLLVRCYPKLTIAPSKSLQEYGRSDRWTLHNIIFLCSAVDKNVLGVLVQNLHITFTQESMTQEYPTTVLHGLN